MTIRRSIRHALTRLSSNQLAERSVAGAIRAAAAADRGGPRTLTILMYHRVTSASEPTLSPTMVNATPPAFGHQLDVVRSVAEFVSVDQVLAAQRGERDLPRRSVLVTFDDAYSDFAEEAWPVLRERGVPVVLFVPTAYPDHPERGFWWDGLWAALHGGRRPLQVGDVARVEEDEDPAAAFRRLRAVLKSLPHADAMALVERAVADAGVRAPEATVLSWQQLHDLEGQGVTIGSHSHTHPLLHRLAPSDAAAEIRRSIDELERRGFAHARTFAYPGGGVDDAVRTAAINAGCQLAVTTKRGTNRLDSLDPFMLRRVNVGQATNASVLTAQLLPSLARSRRWADR